MKKLVAALVLLLGLAGAALAQLPQVFNPPQGSQPSNISNSATGTTGAVAATLTGGSGRFTYICGFVVTSGGTTAANVQTITVTGVQGGTLNFDYVYVSTGQGLLGIALPGCLISSAVNTNIVVNVPGGGTGTNVAVSAWGYLN